MATFGEGHGGARVWARDPNRSPPDPLEIHDAHSELRKALAANETKATANSFWKAVYSVDTWHMLPDLKPGESLESRRSAKVPVEPLAVKLNGKRYVPVFTSERRALAAAVHNNLAKTADEYATLSLDRDLAAAYLCGIPKDRVDGVVFNHNRGEPGVTALIGDIPSMYARHCTKTAPIMFDVLVRTAAQTNADELWENLNSWLASMDRLYFVGARARHRSPSLAIVEGKPVAQLFTSKEHAMQGAAMSEEWRDGEQTPLISMTISDAAAYLEDISRASAEIGHPVASVVVNRGGAAYLTEIADLCAQIRKRTNPLR